MELDMEQLQCDMLGLWAEAEAAARHMRLLLRRMAAEGMGAKVAATMQRCRQLVAQQQELVLGMQVDLRAGHDQNLGSLAVLPQEVLQLLLGSLRARDVRGVSRALRDAFDSCNTRLVLQGSTREKAGPPPPDLDRLVGDLVLRSPQLTELWFKWGCGVPLKEVLLTGGLGSRLQVLDRWDTCCSRDAAEALAQALRPLTALRTLALTRLSRDPSGAPWPALGATEVVNVVLPSLPSLQMLAISTFPGEAVTLVLMDPLGLPALQKLTLHGGYVSAEGAATLAQLTTLQSLELRGAMAAAGCAALAPALCALTGLQTLRLHNIDLDAEAAAALMPCLTALTALTDLDLKRVFLFQAGVATLSPGLQALTGLRRLNLSINHLHDGAELVPALVALTGLQDLDLSGNHLGPPGAAALAPALMQLTALTKLDIGFNDELGAAGAATLAPVLETLVGLRQLNLHKNGLGADGAAALAHALKSLTALVSLGLHGNNVGCGGAQALGPALAALPFLETVLLGENSLGTAGMAAMEPLRKSLRYLDLS